MTVQELLTKWGFEVKTKPLENLEHRLEQIKHRLDFLSAAEMVKGIFELGERFSHFAENLGVAATSAGLTVEELQRLQFAAGQAGVSSEEVSGSMARLSRALYEARNGSASAKEAFAKAGISDAQIAGFKTGSDALRALADRMAGMTDPIAKQALAMQLMGRGSVNMVEFMSDGAAAIDKMGASAEAMGAVVSSADVHSLREMEDALGALGKMVQAISAHFAAMFAPAIKHAVHDIQAFYAANRQLIEVSIEKWAHKAVYALGFVAGVVEEVAKQFFAFARGHEGLFESLGKGAIAYTVIDGIASLGAKLGPALKLLTGPIKLVGPAIRGLAKGFEIIAFKGAILFETMLPTLSSALLTFAGFLEASPLAAVTLLVAAIASLVLIGEAAYTMLFKGGKFKDTWLGQLWEGAKGKAKWVAEKLGLKWFDKDSPAEEERKQAIAGYMAQSTFGSDERFDRGIGRVQTIEEGMRAASSAANMAPPVAGGMAGDPSARFVQTNNVYVTAPNVPLDQQQKAGELFGAGVVGPIKDSAQPVLRQAIKATGSEVRY